MTAILREAGECPPRFATPRTPERKTHGARVAVIAQALGTPFMPWQRQVVDTVLEVDSLTGRLAYREYVITVPRQSGKTTLILPKLVYRCLGAFGVRQRVVYTAQTRNKAREKWETEHVDMLNRSPLGPEGDLYQVRLAAGSERLTWFNGSTHGIDAVTDKAGHGPTLDEGIIDEAFAREDASVEQSMKPAMITRDNAQLGILSTAGTDKSHYLRGKVTTGRALAEARVTSGVAYFEWSAPDGSDPDDPAVWRLCMPALGHTIREESIAADRDSMRELPGEFERAYLNMWPEGHITIQVIPAEAWEGCADPQARHAGRVMWAIDTSPEGKHTAICAAGYAVDGGELVEVIEYREGPNHWVVDRMADLARNAGGCWQVALDGNGPAAELRPDLERAGFEVIRLTGPQIAQACGSFVSASLSTDSDGNYDRLLHRDQKELNVALANASKMKVGDVWRWVRNNQTDISPLYAATLALWGLSTTGESWRNVLDSIA